MSEQETKSTEETNLGGNLDAAGSASGAGSLGASASSKKSEEKRKPKKLGQKGANGTPSKEEADVEVNGEAEAPSTPSKMSDQQSTQASRSKSRGSRTRGRGSSQPPSDTDSAYRSDVSQKAKRNRNRNRGKAQAQSQAQSQDQDGGLLGGGGPLDAVDEVGETLDGVTGGVGDTVNDTAGKALSAPHEALGGLLNNKKKGGGNQAQGQEGEEKDEGENEQLRLRLDLNLDIEVQLKAKIHGDLTLGLLYVPDIPTSANANVSQKLALDRVLCVPVTPVERMFYQAHQGAPRSSASYQMTCPDVEELASGVDMVLHFTRRKESLSFVCNKIIMLTTITEFNS